MLLTCFYKNENKSPIKNRQSIKKSDGLADAAI